MTFTNCETQKTTITRSARGNGARQLRSDFIAGMFKTLFNRIRCRFTYSTGRPKAPNLT